ncbi:LPP20 family lipoprotein [Thiomicrospira pelophila]|uniref:LPP20 family lipoprotein n=1 Tax=Thiomicrospira pelophila TaxID=934 RepID=UPI0004A6E5F1|nr:LPP20 family lipoprotein [Thiomicrospira pelophila]
MKLIKLIPVLSMVGLLAACGGKEVKPEPVQTVVPDCSFPGTTTPAPAWICDAPVPGVEISAVGVTEPSKAGISFMRDQASADARGRLAEQVQVSAQKMVKSYLGTTGVGDAETVDAAASSTVRTLANQELYGSKIYRSLQAPDGRYFVLMGIDKENAQKIIQQSVNTSMKNDQALWQQFQSQKSFDEMSAEIAKQPM